MSAHGYPVSPPVVAPPVPRIRSWQGVLTSPLSKTLARAAVGVILLVAIALQVGAEPFVRGIASISLAAVAAALMLAAVATAAASWRWRLVARRLGLELAWTGAMSSYYRSQFLNTVLAGGVVGDVERAVRHGRDVGAVAQASRAVVLERSAGQAVQLVLATIALLALGLSISAPAVGIVLLVAVVACAGAGIAAIVSVRARAALRREATLLRTALGDLRTLVKLAAASTLVVGCHVAIFVVACLAVGVHAAPQRIAAAALIAVLAASIPTNVGGWGPREGAAAWAFAAMGLGAATGIAASTAFGVLAMIAVAPGAGVVAASALRRRRARRAKPAGEVPAP
jgi:uncharacterized membrane protein YbhN (UPF0104 family)